MKIRVKCKKLFKSVDGCYILFEEGKWYNGYISEDDYYYRIYPTPFTSVTYYFIPRIEGVNEQFEFEEYFYTEADIRELEINKIIYD